MTDPAKIEQGVALHAVPRAALFIERIGSSEFTAVDGLDAIEGPNGVVGFHASELGKIATAAGPDAIIWVQPASLSGDTTTTQRPNEIYRQTSLSMGSVVIDHNRFALMIDGTNVHLQPLEYNLLNALTLKFGRVISREEIVRTCWGGNKVNSSNIVDVYVGQIRKKLRDHSGIIHTIYGKGYMLDDRIEKAPTSPSKS